jgi:hypothetical protein
MQRFVCTSHGLAGAGLLVRWQKTDLMPPQAPPYSVGATLNFSSLFLSVVFF